MAFGSSVGDWKKIWGKYSRRTGPRVKRKKGGGAERIQHGYSSAACGIDYLIAPMKQRALGREIGQMFSRVGINDFLTDLHRRVALIYSADFIRSRIYLFRPCIGAGEWHVDEWLSNYWFQVTL